MKATIRAEWIGMDLDKKMIDFGEKPIRRPWCARIELSRKGFYRSFIKGKIDYKDANSKSSRGVYVWFILESGHVYELKKNNSWKGSERIFLRVLNDGSIQEGAKKEAEQWLSDPLV